MNSEQFLNTLLAIVADLGLKLLAAVVVMLIGRFFIRWVMKLIGKSRVPKVSPLWKRGFSFLAFFDKI